MKTLQYLCLMVALVVFAACGAGEQEAGNGASGTDDPAATTTDDAAPASGRPEAETGSVEIEPGLSMRILKDGSGETAEPGQTVAVHYTGWLYDPAAADNRGQKFDSSRDRGQHFEFPLGSGSVIQGWDRGVAGMQVGEVRELTIAPELAYGDRGAGSVIPPGATLVFEVELADVVGGAPSATN
jgi:FKBP-type peptidyl-prolyl cis-trans isomerase